jgi:anti-sigma factor RsiW
MTDRTDNQSFDEAAGRMLWHRASERFAAPANDPLGRAEEADALLLAAHLDGRLDPAEQEAFEARLAAEPALLELFLQSDQSVGATQPVSDALLVRAAALVPGEAFEKPNLLQRIFGARRESNGRLRLRAASLAATVAAVVVASAIGFEIGRFGYAVAAETYLDQGDSFAQIDGSF